MRAIESQLNICIRDGNAMSAIVSKTNLQSAKFKRFNDGQDEIRVALL